jgi:hypothetical protein
MKILNLTLHAYYFNQILEGRKLNEYRDITHYWRSRLFHKDGTPKKYDVVQFRNGYATDAPVMIVEFCGVTETDCYDISLGRVLSSSNIDKLKVKSPPGHFQSPKVSKVYEPGDLIYNYDQISDCLDNYV